MRVAVVTPYFDEDLDVLDRCHQSVRRQSWPCDHVLVADGRARSEVDDWALAHIRLPQSHGDGGVTPRGIGALHALKQGYDAIAFLDADNWYDPRHIETMVELCRVSQAEVAFAGRHIELLGGGRCPEDDPDVQQHLHVDTSCYFITRAATRLVLAASVLDPGLWQACDRLMFALAQRLRLRCVWSESKTVHYLSRWGLHYAKAGRSSPDDEHRIDWPAVEAAYSIEAMTSRLGFDLYDGRVNGGVALVADYHRSPPPGWGEVVDAQAGD